MNRLAYTNQCTARHTDSHRDGKHGMIRLSTQRARTLYNRYIELGLISSFTNSNIWGERWSKNAPRSTCIGQVIKYRISMFHV